MKQAMKFLNTYKGKDADMIIDKKLVSMKDSLKLVDDAYNAYKEQIKLNFRVIHHNQNNTNKINNHTTVISRNGGKVRIIKG